MFPHLAAYTDFGLLFLRIMVGLVFANSGFQHVRDPRARAKSIELPVAVTIFLGVAEIAGGIGVIIGVWPQLASVGLMLIMLGAIQRKLFSWKTGFWGKDGLGWNT